jgi:hypothetical protein
VIASKSSADRPSALLHFSTVPFSIGLAPVDEPNLMPFVVRREVDDWLFVPSGSFGSLATGLFAAGAAFMVYLSTIFFRSASTAFWIGFGFLAVAGYSVGLAVWSWQSRHVPLRVDRDGGVSYGRRELAARGSVRAVRIQAARDGDAGECTVSLEVAGGRDVFLPQPYFARYPSRHGAQPFAAKLAAVLGVSLVDTT